MNILQILPELNVGGVETGTLDLAKYLVKLGHKAVVVSAGGRLVNELESLGAIHYQLPVHKKSVFTIIEMIPKLAGIIRKEEIDIVHARSRVPAWIAYFAARKTRRVFISTCHGYYKKHPFSYVMGWSKRAIVLSNVIGRHMLEDFGVPFERIRLVPRSVDLDRFKYISPDEKRKDEFNVGIIGRITPIKGHLYFIKAMAKASRVIPRFKVWIVGDAPPSKAAYKDQIRVLVKRLGLWHSTEFLGTQRDIPAILAHLDLLVLATTTQEAFGRVIIEAQASGVPVVATKVGGVVDIIEDNKTGLLVPPADPLSMSEAIVKIFKDEKLAAGLAQSAYKKVKEKYNVELMVKSTLEVYQDALSNFKILIVKFSSLGDVILSTAAIKAIRKRFPADKYKISFLVGEESKDVLLNCPYIDELLVCDFKNKDKGPGGFLKLARILRNKNFDIVIDFQNSRKSHLLSFLTFCLERYGYDRKLGFLINRRVKDSGLPMGPVAHQFRILKELGIDLPRPSFKHNAAEESNGLEDCYLELWPEDKDRRYIDEFLDSQWISPHQRLAGINISASKRWTSKNLPLSCILKLCEGLSNRDMRVVITGTENDLAQANALMNTVKNAKLINACGKTSVNQLACLIKRCSVYISPDSAPLHIAAAVGTPFIAVFGPTDPARHLAPAKDYALLKKDLPCRPCYKSKCKTKKCMELIKPEEILAAVDKLLK